MLEALPFLELVRYHWQEGCFLSPQEPSGLLNLKKELESICQLLVLNARFVLLQWVKCPSFLGVLQVYRTLQRYLCTVFPDFCQVYWQGWRHF